MKQYIAPVVLHTQLITELVLQASERKNEVNDDDIDFDYQSMQEGDGSDAAVKAFGPDEWTLW